MYRCRSMIIGMALIFSWSCSLTASGGVPPLTTERVASGLDRPLWVTHAPGDFDRIFIVEKTGRIKILQGGTVSVFLDIDGRVGGSGSLFSEQGLLGMAFHPDYNSNGFFYVDYTDNAGDTVVSRFTVTGDPDVADDTSEFVLLTLDQPQSNHNGGWIAFGPDGYLYISAGDGGGANDTGTGHTADTGNGQDITDNLFGKLLRIDVDGSNGPGGTYGIPADNPFVGVTGDDEIWAYGLRNPWRNAFDRATGDLYIADVGQNDWEEINFQPASSTGGENWGWNCREGAHDFFAAGPDCGVAGTPSATLLDPIHEYSHADGCSITGGEVYRGCAMPDLHGTYFFADVCSAQIWSFVYTGGSPVVTNRTTELAPGGGLAIENIVSFGLDANGEIYICDQGANLGEGEVFKIVPDGVPSQCPTSVPAADDWGIIAMSLLIVVGGTLFIRRSARPPDLVT